jgi:flagellar assembly factor FliW
MREIKPITTRLMDNLDAPIINNSKREMIREVRDV